MKYFTLKELGGRREDQFHPNFLDELEQLRHIVGIPFYVTSGARSWEHNNRVGGSLTSTHIWDHPQRKGQLGCMAVDVRIIDPWFKVAVFEAGLLLNWSIGLNEKKRFIHLDRRFDIGEKKAVFGY